jgi:hypothetical protein
MMCSGRELILGALTSNFCDREAGAVTFLNPRHKEHDMGLKTFKMTAELTNDTGEVEFTDVMTWKGLEDADVLFLEKHIIAGLSALNSEATAKIAGTK